MFHFVPSLLDFQSLDLGNSLCIFFVIKEGGKFLISNLVVSHYFILDFGLN